MSYSIFDVIKDTVTGQVQKSTKELSVTRIEICNVCPEKNRTFNTCRQCGCYIPGKVSYKESSCPLGKW